MNDGQLGLFDVKSGFTRELAGSKKWTDSSNTLRKEKSKGKKVLGGIVTNTDPTNYKGRWVYFDKQSKDLLPNDLSNWETLEF